MQKRCLKYIALTLRMILRLYSIFIFICDLVSFLFNSYIAILLSFWHLVFPEATKKISDEVVLIIGSSRGIGKELAMQIAAKGSLILCLDITSVENEAVVQQILDNGGRAVSYQCKVIYSRE